MKNPWWQHVLVGCVIILSVIVAWDRWVISTRDHPVVILHRHIYIPDTEERRICDCSQEFRDIREDVQDATERSRAAMTYTENFGVYSNSLFLRIEKHEADIKGLEKKLRQHKHCGEW